MLTSHCKETKQPQKIKVDWFLGYIYRYTPVATALLHARSRKALGLILPDTKVCIRWKFHRLTLRELSRTKMTSVRQTVVVWPTTTSYAINWFEEHFARNVHAIDSLSQMDAGCFLEKVRGVKLGEEPEDYLHLTNQQNAVICIAHKGMTMLPWDPF